MDREELHVGDNGPQVIQNAMDTAMVGLFILSPEFPARAWCMRELMSLQTQEREARERGLPVPKLIPVFYRLDIRSCRNDALFHNTNENGENIEGITAAEIARAMKEVSLRTGIENEDHVTNEDGEGMQQRRSVFIDRLVHEIVEYVVNIHGDTAQSVTRANMVARHASMLHNYCSVGGHVLQMRDGCRTWWEVDNSTDKYVEDNVVRHLIGAGLVREALFLVTKPQWIARQLERCGITSFERDVAWLILTLEICSGSVSDRIEAVEGLALVRNCVRAGLNAILDNPREVHFQICARMVFAKESSLFANNIVLYAEGRALKPSLRALNACAQQAETFDGKMFLCSGARCVQVLEVACMVIVGCWGGEIALFDMETFERKAHWDAHGNCVNCLAVTADERLLVSGSRDKTAKVWDMNNGFDLVADCDVGCEVECADVTPDGKRFVVGDEDGTVSVWELESGRCVAQLLGRHERSVSSIAVSPTGKLAASGDWEGVIKLWSMNNEPEIDSARSAVEGDNLGTSFLLRALARQFEMHSGEHGSELSNVSLFATLGGHLNRVRALCFTTDGRKLVSGSDGDIVQIWDIETGIEVGVAFGGPTDVVRSVSLSADEHKMFSVGDNGAMLVWTMDGYMERRLQFAKEGVWVRDAKIVSDGEEVVWCGGSWVHVTDVRSDLSAADPGSRYKLSVDAMRVTPDGTLVISGSGDGTLIVWDTATGLQVGTTIEGHSRQVRDVAVTPDGQRFVSVSKDDTIRVWDLATHAQLAVLEGQSAFMQCVEISLDGKTAITGSVDCTVLMWDLDACDGSHRGLVGHSDSVRRLYLAQDGLHFVSLSAEDAFLWNTENADFVKRIEKEDAYQMSADEIEGMFGVPILSSLRISDIRLGSSWNKITYQQGGTQLVLATMDSRINSMDFSGVTKTLCVGLASGHVGIFELELEDDGDIVEVEQ